MRRETFLSFGIYDSKGIGYELRKTIFQVHVIGSRNYTFKFMCNFKHKNWN